MTSQSNSQHLFDVLLIIAGVTWTLLLYSHLMVGAVTMMDGQAPPPGISRAAADEATLVSAISDLAQSGAYMFMFFVAILSGLWPYGKLLGTVLVSRLVCRGSLPRRQARIDLEWLEVVGKWSFADVILLCLDMVFFNIITETHTTLVGPLRIELWFEPRFPAFALIAAITSSSILTHWVVTQLAPSVSQSGNTAGEQSPLLIREPEEDQVTRLGMTTSLLDGSTDPQKAARIAAMAVASCAAAMFHIAGMFLPLIWVERTGFLGKLLAEEQRDIDLSVVGITLRMWQIAGDSDHSASLLTHIFAVVFAILCFASPLLELLLMALSAVASGIDEAWSSCFRTFAGWVRSFACADVLLLVTLACVVDLQRVVAFNVGDQCKSFGTLMSNHLLMQTLGLGTASSSDCLFIDAQIQPGWFVLAAATVLRVIARCFGYHSGFIGSLAGMNPSTPKSSPFGSRSFKKETDEETKGSTRAGFS